MFRILIVLCLAAASFGAAAQEPPGELAPQQDLYLIVLQPDQRGEPPFDPASFGGRLEHRKGSRLAVRMTAEAAAAVEQNPRVKTVQRITLGRPERPEGGRADARVIIHGNDSLTGGIYTYDGSGNIRSIGPNSDGGTDQFTYDEFGRLASAKVHSGGTPYLEWYGYDGAGNLTQLVKPNLTINLPAEAATNRLSSSLGVAYDDTGHLTQSPVGSYEYDQVGMMSGTSEGRTYIYTASGERILIVPSSGGGLWRWTLRDLAGRKVREYESEREDFFLWLEDDYHDGQRLIASQRETAEGGRRHYHPDHLGTPRLITNAGGQRISTHDYYPFGVEITSIHQEAARGYGREQTAQFTGHERDDMDSSLTEHSVYLDYMHARFYNPNWGRFLTVDPLMAPQRNMTTPQRWNRYAYTVNNPVKYVDPDGRKDTIYIVSMFSREHTPIFRAALNKAIAGTRFEGRVEVYGPQATRGQMHAAVALGDRTDIVAALLHSGRKPADQGGTMMGETAAGRVDSANPFTGNQLASWAARDGDAPTVILGGCSSDGCAAALAKATGSTAFGTTARTWNSEAMNAMVAMIGVLAHGGTDTEAADAGSAQLVNLPPCELARPRCNEDRKDPADIIAKDPD